MTKEAELMDFLEVNVFGPILNSQNASAEIKKGVNLTIGRMKQLTAAKMIEYYWSALASENSIAFAKKLRAAGLPCFENVLWAFRDKFTPKWAKN
jgi:hypothetical protein